jgi:peptidyl-prolyl cis-trans isomerase SurA
MKKFLFVFLMLLFAAPAYAQLQSDASIIAVVNDEAITKADLDDRVALVFLSSGLPQDEASRKKIADRTLQSLIDEHLQMQEARRYNIEVNQDDIDKAVGKVAAQNNMNASQLETMFRSKGVTKQTLVDQVKAGLSWARLAQRVLRPQVSVGDDEVNAAIERIKTNEGKPEYLMSEIFLSVNKPSDEDRVRDLANELVKRMHAGAHFSAIAQQFSQGIGAINGGDLGWIQPGQLNGEMDRAVRQLQTGQISLPIRVADGFHILGKRDERVITATDPTATEVHLKQASMLAKGKPEGPTVAEIKRFAETKKTCESLNNMSDAPAWTVTDIGTKKVRGLPQWMGGLVRQLPVNSSSPPMEKNGYAMFLFVCDRIESGSNREAVVESLGLEKLELQAQRLMRDLRRTAAIDIRSERQATAQAQ